MSVWEVPWARRTALAVVATAALAAQTETASAIPLPNPVAIVTTESGGVTRVTPVPILGVPVPIDVDDGKILGLLCPDIDVSVSAIALSELPGSPLVPNVVVTRNALALARKAPAPPLKIDVRVFIANVLPGIQPLADIHYGFETPPGGRVPTRVAAKLTGPVQGGFVNPLEAFIETPGYNGALDVHIDATTLTNEYEFDLGFDPLPEKIHVVADPHDDKQGLDLLYEHEGPNPDVELRAHARFVDQGDPIEIDAHVERVPARLEARMRTTALQTSFDYAFSAPIGKPDVAAHIVDRTAGTPGVLVTDATLRAGGLAPKLHAQLDYVPAEGGGRDLDRAHVQALDGGEIDVVEFDATNVDGIPLPVQDLGPDQLLSATTRVLADNTTRYRAAGRVEGVREVRYERVDPANEGVQVETDIGDGVKPLRAVVDLDRRGVSIGKSLIAVDATLRPLPKTALATYTPATDDDGATVDYALSSTIDATASITTASGAASLCGGARVTCADLAIDGVPEHLNAKLPGQGGSDYAIAHSGGAPDIDVVLDATPVDVAQRVFAEIALEDVPDVVNARIDVRDGTPRQAEFHACTIDYDTQTCTGDEGALGAVSFAVRNREVRPASLPDSGLGRGPQLGYVARGEDFEASGRVEDVRSVAFHQRRKELKTYGVRVDVGDGQQPLDVRVDTDDTELDVNVAPLPTDFSACVRSPSEGGLAPPGGPDALIAPCEGDPPVEPDEDEPLGNPLVAVYDAPKGSKPTVRARLQKTKVIPGTEQDPPTVERIDVATRIEEVPDHVETAVLPGLPNRALKARYRAEDQIPQVDLSVSQRIGPAECGDPRPHTRAMCLEARLTDLPRDIAVTYDGSDTDPVATFVTKPLPTDEPTSIPRLRIASVAPKETGKPRPVIRIDGAITGLPEGLRAALAKRDLGGPEPEVAKLDVDACFGQADDCPGIGAVDLTATNQLGGDALHAVPAIPDEPAQRLSLVQLGDHFRAHARLQQFRRVGLSRLRVNGQPSDTTDLRARFGAPGQALRAYVDRGLSGGQQAIDAVVRQAPQDLRACFRPPLGEGETPLAHPDEPFCAKQVTDATAVQVRATSPSGEKPDIELRRLLLRKGTSTVSGTAAIEDLAEKVNVLFAQTDAGPRASVAGQNADDPDDSPPEAVAKRITFDLKTTLSKLPTEGFPAQSLDGAVDPDQTHDDYLVLHKHADRMAVRASIGGLRAVRVAPEPCLPDDRYPATLPVEQRPTYTCLQAHAEPGHDLGLAVRTVDGKGDIVAFDDAELRELPAGDEGLAVTIAAAPKGTGDLPVCGNGLTADCRPPLLSARADRASGQQKPVLAGRIALGALQDVKILRDRKPLDLLSRRLDYEESPRTVGYRRGIRAKVALDGPEFAAFRAGMLLELPGFLDIDPIVTFSCKGTVAGDGTCVPGPVDKEHDIGFEALDLAVRVAGSDKGHYVPDPAVPDLGSLALFVRDIDPQETFAEDPERRLEMIVTGAPFVEGHATEWHGEHPQPPGAHDFGAPIPGYTDLRVYKRDEFVPPSHHQFIQADGWFSHPLYVQLRDNSLGAGLNRANQDVPGRQYTIRRAPGMDGLEELTAAPAEPTFRLRADIRANHNGVKTAFAGCKSGVGFDFSKYGFPAACIVLSEDIGVPWLDLQVDAHPAGEEHPARLIEAVLDRRTGKVIKSRNTGDKVHVRGFATADYKTTGGALDDPSAARRVGVDAALRLDPFDLALRTGRGIGVAGYTREAAFEKADLVLGVTALSSDVRVRRNILTLMAGLAADGDQITAETSYKGRLTARFGGSLLFGRLSHSEAISLDYNHHALTFAPCSQINKPPNAKFAKDAFSWLGPNPDGFKLALFPQDFAAAAPSKELAILAAAMPGLACVFPNGMRTLVDADFPAPFYAIKDHDVPGFKTLPGDYDPDGDPEPEPEPQLDSYVVPNDTIGIDRVACGVLDASEIVIEPGAELGVGMEGSQTIGPDGSMIDCEGDLTLDAQRITVHEGARIIGYGTHTVPGPGTPTTGTGGGAGHVNEGGASGDNSGDGGPAYAADEERRSGSPGRFGFFGEPPGGGGPVIELSASHTITVAGAVESQGGEGGSHTECATGAAGGGGSGGTVYLAAPRVILTEGSRLTANGGRGGGVTNSGGGGAGGRVRVDTIAGDLDGDRFATGAEPGTPSDGCGLGGKGDGGHAIGGENLGVDATVQRTDSGDATFVNTFKMPLRVDAVRDGGGPTAIVVCPRRVAPGDPDGFANPALNPDPNDIKNDKCFGLPFAGGTDGPEIYHGTIEVIFNLGDGFYGFYAHAYHSPHGHDCVTKTEDCEALGPAPEVSTAFAVVDRTPPVVGPITHELGSANCAAINDDPSGGCTRESTATINVSIDDNFAHEGLTTTCLRGTQPILSPCGPGTVKIPVLQGVNGTLKVKAVDRAGNPQTEAVPKIIMDPVAPTTPKATRSGGTLHASGYYTSPPSVTFTTNEPNTNQIGFTTQAFTVFVDGAPVPCPTVVDGLEATCTLPPAKVEQLTLGDGEHVFSATARDALGNEPPHQFPLTLRFDNKPPASSIFLGPEAQPNGWHTTRPILAFSFSDTPGGSGVDFDAPGSLARLRYQVDDNPIELWTPATAPRLVDGVHFVCWAAYDVVGNEPSEGECQTGIRVDSTPPDVAIDVPDPDGLEGWYRTAPTATISADDPSPGSDLERVEYRLDDGEWTEGTQVPIGPGRHVLRARAFDKAGNVSNVAYRRFAVDTGRPSVALRSYPPDANAQGWFRQQGAHRVTADDGPPPASGVASALHGVDDTPFVVYQAPVGIIEGQHQYRGRSRDTAGNDSADVARTVRVDETAPRPLPSFDPVTPILLPGQTTKLKFHVSDALSSKVRVRVTVFSAFHWAMRSIDAAGGYRPVGPGEVVWDGKRDNGNGVLPGTYWYRVSAVDQAGNTAQSTEGGPIVVGVTQNVLGVGTLLGKLL